VRATGTGTLDPARTVRTPVAELAPDAALSRALALVDASIAMHFPENLFGDLDRLAHDLALVRDREGEAAMSSRAARIAHVHALFGRETVLHFRYTHDFLYGYDWARWVARDPGERGGVGPYDDAFLAYSEQRAGELVALVAAGDGKYGQLAPGVHRNPFPFRRDLEAERVLHRALAADDLVPVQAWRRDGTARWDLPFSALREERAKGLGLSLASPV